MAECIFCKKQYVGNTTQKLRDRITGHRISRESALKIHLDSHNSTFNQTFKFVVLSHSSPEKLNELESIWISCALVSLMALIGLIRVHYAPALQKFINISTHPSCTVISCYWSLPFQMFLH